MKTEASVGLLLLLVTAKEGTCSMMNLTAAAEAYLNSTVDGGWKSWGLDKSYVYWTGAHLTIPEWPIKGKVDGFQQDEACNQSLSAGNRVCKERFMWTFKNGIWSPFELLVNVTIEQLEGTPVTFELDLNNANWILKPQRLDLNAMKVATTQHKVKDTDLPERRIKVVYAKLRADV
ncbi:uncharacterized protein LOC142578057 [Dermacentor variabilis]|uniref:uncharacterized protein LOC142578057 n=1 Tax=Dermacentor variabilis TaxID=34621 RepID=UPI003F5BB12F